MNKKNKILLIKIIRIIALIILLFAVFKGVFVLLVLMLLSLSMSYLVNKFQLRNLGIELVTLIAVLTGMKYGPWTALIITFILILYHLSAGGFFGHYWFWVVPTYCLAGVISGFFRVADVATLGMYVTLGINIVSTLFTGITSPTFLPKYLPFVISNIIFNILLFNLVGNVLLLLLI